MHRSSPSQDLRITLIQTELHWQQPETNRRMLTDKLAPLAGNTDLIILPEMFSTGFSMAPEQLAEPEPGETLRWMQQQAQQTGAAITGSVMVQDDQGFRNRLYWVTPDGQVQHYDKRHLFRMASEQEHYVAGQQRLVVNYRGWRILPQVCYDLRFPVFSRNRGDYDLAIYVANWPESRRHAWRILLQARAIENLSYVAGVNRVGTDGKGLSYSGDSLLADFAGQLLLDHQAGGRFVETRTLSAEQLNGFRNSFPAWQDADDFSLLS
ncbi:amidohydrolase [Marinospirillum alkaliphilum]|uniref:Omega-amidase YafV n=1 Tax=Marinospirillum alkaliphilum DSM 21637 TaxID=1122209 RepID=A0A1K1V1Z4_9GAMM|nr:amidohydrolase [Marinospirillum alkaliphilum]SFX19118.1 Carbon-nitrogen hydrolase [Marinospirillum alkaliphilum DSM 21637]